MAKIVKRHEAEKNTGTPARRSAPPADVQSVSAAGGVVHKRVVDARAHAEEIVIQAQARAEAIRDEAEALLEKAKGERQELIKKGFAEGESKGLAQVTEKLVAFEALKDRFYADAEPEVIKLVMSIAEKVIGRIVDESAEMIRSVVRQALERAIGDRITVRLNPSDYQSMMAGEHEFRDVLDRTKRLVFREDETIMKGGCVVETEVGTIDAQLDRQLDAIRKALIT